MTLHGAGQRASSANPPIMAILAATGVMGTLVARELAAQGIPLRLGARSAEKLNALAATLPPHSQVTLHVVDAQDVFAVRDFCQPTAVLLQCAGPYTDMGDVPIQAALATQTHVLDVTGEQPWVLQSHRRYDEMARQNGVAIGHAMGVEVVLADLAATELLRHAPQATHLTLAHAVRDFASSRGSRLSALRVTQQSSVAFIDGRHRPCPAGSQWRQVILDPPFATRGAVSLPGVELWSIPQQHLQLRDVTSWLALPGPVRGDVSVARALSLAARLHHRVHPWLPQRVLNQAIGLSQATPEHTDPQAYFQIALEASREVSGQSHPLARLVLHAHGPYSLSARILVYCAVQLLRKGPAIGRGGVLAPGQVVDPRALWQHMVQEKWLRTTLHMHQVQG